jgi:hypothetical protein
MLSLQYLYRYDRASFAHWILLFPVFANNYYFRAYAETVTLLPITVVLHSKLQCAQQMCPLNFASSLFTIIVEISCICLIAYISDLHGMQNFF